MMGRAFPCPLKLLAPPPTAIAHARRRPHTALPSSNSLQDDEHPGLRAGGGGGRGKYDEDLYLSRNGWRRLSATIPLINSLPMRPTVHLDLLVPIRDNDGVPFTDADFDTFEDYLLGTVGGFTRRSDVEGAWRSPEGVTMRDRSRAYTLTLPEERAAMQMLLVSDYIKSRFRQEAVFVEQIPTLAAEF
jgi:hypothetical protein